MDLSDKLQPCDAPVSYPLHVTIGLTSSCTLDCVYCYAQPFNGAMIPIDEAKGLIKSLYDKGVFIIKIGGGEPFLHPEIFQLLDFIAENRIPVAILSNGTQPTKDNLDRLSKLLLAHPFINYQISLDSVYPEENDVTRGQTNLVLDNISYLSEKGVPLQIATVISNQNIHSVEKLIEYFFPRVRKYHFMNIMPTPKALPGFKKLCPSPQDLEEFWSKRVRYFKKRFGAQLVLTAESHIQDEFQGGETAAVGSCCIPGCLAAATFIDIDANLDVLACNCANTFRLGNLRYNTLQEIWDSPVACRTRAIPIPLCQLYAKAAIANEAAQ